MENYIVSKKLNETHKEDCSQCGNTFSTEKMDFWQGWGWVCEGCIEGLRKAGLIS